MTAQFARVGWTDRADAEAEYLWVFFDMKDGTKPEGSQLITPSGYVLPRSALILHLKKFERVSEMWDISCQNRHESSCFLLSAQRRVFS